MECSFEEPEFKVKDISFLFGLDGRKIEDVIIIDNDPFKYSLCLKNGVPINNFSGDSKDNSLKHLEHFIMTLVKAQDVRIRISQDFLVYWLSYK